MSLTLRPRQQADLPTLADIVREVHLADGYPSLMPQDPITFLTPPDVGAWVALSGDTVVGQVVLRRPSEPLPQWLRILGLPAAELAFPSRLFVRPSARGQGAAAQLFEIAWAAARARGWRAALDVNTHSHAAIRLYERQGWQRVTTMAGDWLEPDGSIPMVHVYLSPEV